MTRPKPRLVDAAKVALRQLGRPASSSEIAKYILEHETLSSSLGGRTPHKTVQARLARDILDNKQNSEFYRFGPASFALRELAENGQYNSAYKRIFLARPRRRQVENTSVAVISSLNLRKSPELFYFDEESMPLSAVQMMGIHFINSRSLPKENEFSLVLTYFAIVYMDKVLCFEQTGYGSENSQQIGRISIGFGGALRGQDRTLFSDDAIGFQESVTRELGDAFFFLGNRINRSIETIRYLGLMRDERRGERPHQLGLAGLVCVNEAFEVDAPHLGVSNLHWISLYSKPNRFDKFDGWSQFLFHRLSKIDAHTFSAPSLSE